MKNIHKIIESPIEIKDKCSWWLKTPQNSLYRWEDSLLEWVPIHVTTSEIIEVDPEYTAWYTPRQQILNNVLDTVVQNPTTKFLNGNR